MNNEEPNPVIEELVRLYNAAFDDASHFPAFSEKCREMDLPTYLNQQLIGCEELVAKSADDLRRRWQQTLDDRAYAQDLEKLLLKQEKKQAAAAEQRRKKQAEAMDTLVAKARSCDDMTFRDLQKWHSGKFLLSFGLSTQRFSQFVWI